MNPLQSLLRSFSQCYPNKHSLSLPAYARSAPSVSYRSHKCECLCNLSLEDMVDRDGLALRRAGSIEYAEEVITGREGRLTKSPAF